MARISKKFLTVLLLLTATTCMSFGAKYTVNTSGTVKNHSGKIIVSPGQSVNQRYYVPSGTGNTYSFPIINNLDGNLGTTPKTPNQTSNFAPNYNNTSTGNSSQIIENYFNNYQAQNYISSNQVNAPSVGIIEFVMDYSGSMSNWIEVAKRSMTDILAQISPDTNVGFRVFGHNHNGNNPSTINTVQDVKKIVKKGNKFKVITEKGCLGTTSGICSATEQVAPILPVNIKSLISGMNSVSLGGATPLVYALDRTVYQDFQRFDTTTPKKIVLITDGGENCGGNPCAFAKKLMKNRSDVHIDVVLVSSNSKALACLSTTTGGHFYSVDNLADFTTTINESMQAQPTIQPQINGQKYEYVGE